MIPKPEPRRKKRPNPGHPYLRWLKRQPDVLTGEMGCEAAHVRGPLSRKSNEPQPRRVAESYLSAISLTPENHRLAPDSIERLGETQWGIHHFGRPDAAARIAHRQLAQWALERGR